MFIIKLLLFVFLVVIIFFVGTLARIFFGMSSGSRQKTNRRPNGRSSSRRRFGHEAEAERMLACAVCGVHVPESEGVKAAGKFFCCEAHSK